MNAVSGPRGITFQWELLRRFPTVLPGFIAISLFGHATAFFLFRVVYPPQATMTAPPPAITVLDLTRPDHQALLRWIEAEDPAPAAIAQSSIADRLLALPYRSSYHVLRTLPIVASETPPQFQYPPPRDPLAIIRSADPKPARAPAPEASRATVVRFSPTLSPRQPQSLAPLTLKAKAAVPIEPATYLIGVTDRGIVQFVLPQRSSGQAELDAEAASYLASLKLGPADAPITWGQATIEWGREVYTPRAAASSP